MKTMRFCGVIFVFVLLALPVIGAAQKGKSTPNDEKKERGEALELIFKDLMRGKESAEVWDKNRKLLAAHIEKYPKIAPRIIDFYLETVQNTENPQTKLEAQGAFSEILPEIEYFPKLSPAYLQRVYDALSEELTICKQKYGEDDVKTAERFYKLGIVLNEQKKYELALICYRKSLDIRMRKLGADHLEVCHSFHNIGIVYFELGHFEKAADSFKQCLNILRKKLGEHLTIAESLDNLGHNFRDKEQYELALDFYQQALDIKKKKLGNDHSDAAKSLMNIGIVYYHQGRGNQALDCGRRALDIIKLKTDNKNPEIVRILIFMSGCYSIMDQYELALNCGRRALDTQRKISGNKNPETALCLYNIGYIHFTYGEQYEKALEYFRQALDILQSLDGRRHEDLQDRIVSCLNAIGNCYRQKKQYEQALEFYQQAANMMKNNCESPEKTGYYGNLAACYQEMGNFAEANRYYEKIRQISGIPQSDFLWVLSRTQTNKELLLQRYDQQLRSALKTQKVDEVTLVMQSLLQFYSNFETMDESIIDMLDKLERQLWSQKSFNEYFLFLSNFNASFSALLAKQGKRNNYFENLERNLAEFKDGTPERLKALAVLSSHYFMLRNTDWADGKNYAKQAIGLACNLQEYSDALTLYRILLMLMIRMNDDDFPQTYRDAVNLARQQKSVRHEEIFLLHKRVHDFLLAPDRIKAEAVSNLKILQTPEGSQELWSLLSDSLKSKSPEIVYLLKMVKPETIKKIPFAHRRTVADLFARAGEQAEVKRWTKPQPGTIHKLIYLDAAVQNDDPEEIKMNADELVALQPTAFKLHGINYSEDDMDLLLSVTRCKYAKRLMDDAMLFRSAKHAEELINSGKCDKTFIQILQNEIDSVLCDYYYLNRDFDAAQEKVSLMLNHCSEIDARYPWILMQSGLCHLAKGENKEAADDFKKSGDLFLNADKKWQSTVAYRNLACALYRLGSYEKARSAMYQRHKLSVAINSHGMDFNPGDVDEILIIELKTLAESGKFTRVQKAEEFKALQKRIQQSKSPLVRCDFLLASAEFQKEILRTPDIPAVIRDLENYLKFKESIAAEEWLRMPSFLPDGEERARKMLYSLLKEQNTAESIAKLDYWNKKFEHGRVRSLSIPTFAGSEENDDNVSDIALLDLIDQLQSAKTIVEAELRKPEAERDKKLLQAATSTKLRLENLFEMKNRLLSKEKQAKFRELAADRFLIPADVLTQLSSALEPGTVCLQFIPVDDDILVYLVTHDAPPILQTIHLKNHALTGRDFQKQLQRLRGLLESGSSREATVKKELKKIYDILIADLIPAIERLGTKKVLVNSMGILRYIPFAALYDGRRYLVEKYQITNATGLDLVRLSRASAHHVMDEVKVVVFANPDGSLPSAQKEGEKIASLFPQKQVFIGPKATLDELNALAGDVNFLHFATHGEIDANHPRNSFIMLANGTKWRYCDMMGFNIKNVDSIVLSACKSAMSDKATGGEIEGMAYQLLRKSPAGSVLASLWRVDDRATSILMDVYYRHIVESIVRQHRLDRGGALRAAQLELLKSPETRNPYFWAAFTLFGDCR